MKSKHEQPAVAEIDPALDRSQPTPAGPVNEKLCPVCNPKQVALRMREGVCWIEYGCPGCHLVWLDQKFQVPDLKMRKR